MESKPSNFLKTALSWNGSVSIKIKVLVICFVLYSFIITALQQLIYKEMYLNLGPFEISGTIVGLLLVFRINSGYDRWWEARKLWGSLLNHCRVITASAFEYGPQDPIWRRNFVGWVLSLAYVAKKILRPDTDDTESPLFLPESERKKIYNSSNRIRYIGQGLAKLLDQANRKQEMSGVAFLQLDKERIILLEHIGACERILKSPLPQVLNIKIRGFFLLFLIIVPFSLTNKLAWATPLAMFLITYPVLALDQISEELQNPFSKLSLGHLPLNEFTNKIQSELLEIINEAHACDSCTERCYLFDQNSRVTACMSQRHLRIECRDTYRQL